MNDKPVPLSALFLKQRGSCCGSGCLNCPFVPRHSKGTMQVDHHFVSFQETYPNKNHPDYKKDSE